MRSDAGRKYWQQLAGCVIAGKYELFDIIGLGASGCVFRAEQRIGNLEPRKVAVKLIEGVRGAEKELVTALELRHPNVLRCYDFGETTQRYRTLYYLVMELADGSLADHLRNSTPSSEAFRQIFLEIARGIHYLHTHANTYVHRDIKPGNILRVGETWKIGDFGIMEPLPDDMTKLTTYNPGTLRYMSPEANDLKITPAWDVWSMGVLMVYCVRYRAAEPARTPVQLTEVLMVYCVRYRATTTGLRGNTERKFSLATLRAVSGLSASRRT